MRRVVYRETAGAGWWDVMFVTDRGGRVEVAGCEVRLAGGTYSLLYTLHSHSQYTVQAKLQL